MKNKIIYAVLLFLTIGIVSKGQINQHITFNANYTINNVLLNSNYYSRIIMPDLQSGDSIGYPALPIKYIQLVIPQNCDANSIVINNISRQDVYIDNIIEPLQPPIPISLNYHSEDFVHPDSTRYSSRTPYPVNIVRIVHQDYFRGHHVVTLAVYPFQYTPAYNKLEFISSVDFTLQYSPNNISHKKQMADSSTLKLLSSIVENKDDIKKFLIQNMPNNGIKTGISINCDYVIVTSQALAPAFAQFMAWKKRKGIDIKLVTTEDIYANYTGDNISGINDDAGKIRQFLFDTYNNSTNFQYALLAGYYTIVPVRKGYAWDNYDDDLYVIPTDLYFADFDGDWEVDNDGRYGEPQDNVDFAPEIYVGRIGVQTTQEVENWIRKTLLYEQNPGNGDYSYLTRAFFTQADQMQSTNDANTVLNECSWISSRVIFNEDNNQSGGHYTSYTPSFPTGVSVINEFNNHYGFCSFMGHGGADNVAVATLYHNSCDETNNYLKHKVQSFDNGGSGSCFFIETGNGFDNMTNNNYPTIMYSMSCETAQSDFNGASGNRSMAEAYTVVVNGGGSHYLGNTRYGYYPLSTNMFIDFCRAISNYTIYKIGITEAYSKINYISNYMQYTHNLFGCPETEIWTATPSLFSSASVTENGYSVTVNSGGVSGCTICVMSALDNGNSYFNVQPNVSSYTFTNVPQPYLVTITKHDYIPYMKDPDNIYIQNETINTDRYIYGVNFFAGENVTNQLPQGPVVITNNANVVFDFSNSVNLEGGFEIQIGSTFETK